MRYDYDNVCNADRLSPEALTRPEAVTELNRQLEEHIKQQCPAVKWIANYAVLGPYDYLDIFEAPDAEAATKVALLVRSFGHATTETWVATPWDQYAQMATHLGGTITVPHQRTLLVQVPGSSSIRFVGP